MNLEFAFKQINNINWVKFATATDNQQLAVTGFYFIAILKLLEDLQEIPAASGGEIDKYLSQKFEQHKLYEITQQLSRLAEEVGERLDELTELEGDE